MADVALNHRTSFGTPAQRPLNRQKSSYNLRQFHMTVASGPAGVRTGARLTCPSSVSRTLLEALAVETEWRISEADRLNMRFGETTITDYNLLEFRRANLPNIRVFHVPPLR